MALHTSNPDPNSFVRSMRRVYHPIGFKKGYNFILFSIFAGALMGFVLARLEYLSINGIFKKGAAPGEWFYYSRAFYKAGITLHLSCILPAGFLAVFQFVPAIRHKALILHRVNGYIVILLLLLGNIGALMIARHAFGGTMATQAFVGILAISTTVSALLSYYNIKRLQIDQHRAWMLRCWFYVGSIITLRLVMIISALIISQMRGYYIAMPCQQIAYMGGNATVYPNCAADSKGYTAVKADLSTPQSVENVSASLQINFGMAGFLALWLHAVGIEMYLRLTPAEGERLRKVSFERQLERGFSHPGSSGLTVDRLGDAEEWKPASVESKSERKFSGPAISNDSDSDTDSKSDVERPKPVLGWR